MMYSGSGEARGPPKGRAAGRPDLSWVALLV